MGTIDLPYIERNRSRHGTVRFYFRIDGKRICRLPDDPNSEEFAAKYWAMRKATQAPPAADQQKRALSLIVKPNTFRWLCMTHMKTDAFTLLDPTTQSKRRSIIESMWIEPIKLEDPKGRILADIPLGSMTPQHIEILRDRKKETPFAADERLKVLRQIFETQINGQPVMANIAKSVRPFKQRTEGHATALPEHLRQFIQHHGAGSKAVLCLALLMFTGMRVSDAARIGPQHRNGEVLRMRLWKNRNRTPVDIEIPIHPILETILDSHPAKGMAYLLTEYGRPYSIKGLGNRISDWFAQAGLEDLTAHSVRKGLATNVANNSATDLELSSMFGWRDSKTSQVYTAKANRARLARQAVLKIDWEGLGNALIEGAEDGTEEQQTATP